MSKRLQIIVYLAALAGVALAISLLEYSNTNNSNNSSEVSNSIINELKIEVSELHNEVDELRDIVETLLEDSSKETGEEHLKDNEETDESTEEGYMPRFSDIKSKVEINGYKNLEENLSKGLVEVTIEFDNRTGKTIESLEGTIIMKLKGEEVYSNVHIENADIVTGTFTEVVCSIDLSEYTDTIDLKESLDSTIKLIPYNITFSDGTILSQ